jgi:hypothetical protein
MPIPALQSSENIRVRIDPVVFQKCQGERLFEGDRGGCDPNVDPALDQLLGDRGKLMHQIVVAEVAHNLHQSDREGFAAATGDQTGALQLGRKLTGALARATQISGQVTHARRASGVAEVAADRGDAGGLGTAQGHGA